MNNYHLHGEKNKTRSMDTSMEKNDLLCLDQRYATNSYESTLPNKIINNRDLTITEENYKPTSVIKENSSNQIVALKRTLNLQNTEENHDNVCLERETKYFSIKKSLNVNPSSVITVLNYKQTTNDNVIYMCNICGQSSVDLHQFALHMSTHYECSNQECSVCDQTFPSLALWAKHLVYHQERVNSNHQTNSHIIKPTINITSNSVSEECEKKWLCGICHKKFTKHCHLTYHIESHHRENPMFTEKQIAKSSNFYDGIDCINGNKIKLSTEVTINSSSVTVDTITNNLVGEISNDALTKSVALHSNHKSCNTNQIKSRNFFINEKVQNVINENIDTIKTNRNGEHKFKENHGNSELGNYSTAEVNVSNLNNSGDFLFPCDVCEEKYSCPFLLISHRRWSHQGIEPYLCKICNRTYTVRFQWNRHLKTHYSKIKGDSEEKTNVSKLDTSLLITKSVHLKSQYNCEYCKKVFILLSHWENHLRQNQECYNYLKNVADMKSLEKKTYNTQSAYFECSICAKTFSIKDDCKKHILLIHKLAHSTGLVTNSSTNDIEQKTESSTETNQKNSKLSIQNESHMISGNIRYKCKACGNSYIHHSSLYRHRICEHNSESSVLKCAICNKVFKHKYAMVPHLKKHRSQLLSINKSVTDKKIKQHIKKIKNSDIVKYICQICKMEFIDQMTLLNHVKEHTRNMYKCKDCSLWFETNFALCMHILSDHNTSVTPKTN